MVCPWNSLGKNIGVGCHSLLQGIFPTQGSKEDILHCRQIFYPLIYQGCPKEQNIGGKITIKTLRTSPMVQCRGTGSILVQEDSPFHGWGGQPCLTTAVEPAPLGACALQPEKPLLWEARAPPGPSAARNKALKSSSGVGSFITPIFIHSSAHVEWPRLKNTVLKGETLWFGLISCFPAPNI